MYWNYWLDCYEDTKTYELLQPIIGYEHGNFVTLHSVMLEEAKEIARQLDLDLAELIDLDKEDNAYT